MTGEPMPDAELDAIRTRIKDGPRAPLHGYRDDRLVLLAEVERLRGMHNVPSDHYERLVAVVRAADHWRRSGRWWGDLFQVLAALDALTADDIEAVSDGG